MSLGTSLGECFSGTFFDIDFVGHNRIQGHLSCIGGAELSRKKEKILFGAGVFGQAALAYFGHEEIFCFADNYKHGQQIGGKQIISFEELLKIHKNYDVIITANCVVSSDLTEQCIMHDVPFHMSTDYITWNDYEINEEILKYKNRYDGKRCFLIGNGPSLKAEDLNKLYINKEISFGCNYIYKIFNETAWRPSYYVVSDLAFIKLDYKNFAELDIDVKFIGNPTQIMDIDEDILNVLQIGNGKVHFFNKVVMHDDSNVLPFSPDPSRAVYTGGTVMYAMIQFAVYFGFSEIYLLGVDNNYVPMIDTLRRNDKVNHFYNVDASINEQTIEIRGLASVDGSINAKLLEYTYTIAAKYCKKHNIKIFNATRGGKLEVFRRYDFDNLFC